MKDKIQCRKCNHYFETKKHLKYRVTSLKSFLDIIAYKRVRPVFYREGGNTDAISESNVIVCPKCGNEFMAPNYKYFGFLSLAGLRMVIIIFLLLIILFPLYSILKVLVK